MCYKNIVCDLLEFLRQVSKFLQIASFDLIFSCFSVFFFLFWEERDIKCEQKYLFTPNFNRGGLRKTNGTYLRWVK